VSLGQAALAEYLAFGFVPSAVPAPAAVEPVPPGVDPDEIARELVARLRAALPADEPLALTGDVASGLLCALAASDGAVVRTLTPDAGGGPELARLVAHQYGTDHRDVAVDASRLGRVLAACASPIGDPDALALLAAVSEGAVVTAVGAEELFGGRLRPRLPWPGRDPFRAHLADREVFDADERARLLGSAGEEEVGRVWRERFAAGDALDEVARLQDLDLALPLGCGLLPALEAVRPEHRAPYLADAVASLALGLPADFKVHGLTTLRLLRRAALPFLPGAVVHGPRASAADGLGEVAREVLAPERVQAQTVLDPAEVARVLRRGRPREVWTLAALVLWLEHAP
jgi:asparagine synthetase B (glutamine-hydrolysing)